MKKLKLVVGASALAIAGLGFVPMGAQASGVHTKGTGTATPVAPLNANQQLVQFTCTATSFGVYSSSTVESCSLYANGAYVTSAQRLSLPGNASATSATAAVRLGATLKVCYDVVGQPVLGPATNEAPKCTTVNTVVAAA